MNNYLTLLFEMKLTLKKANLKPTNFVICPSIMIKTKIL